MPSMETVLKSALRRGVGMGVAECMKVVRQAPPEATRDQILVMLDQCMERLATQPDAPTATNETAMSASIRERIEYGRANGPYEG